MKRWLIGTIWREPGGEWVPGATISTTSGEVSKDSIISDWLRTQKELHPNRQFSGSFYIEDLEMHLRASQVRSDGKDPIAKILQRLETAEALIRYMAPIVRAAVAWGQQPALNEKSTKEEITSSFALDLKLSLTLTGDWEEGPDGKWREKGGAACN